MDQATIQRYQSGGDIYNDLQSRFGTIAAQAAANAALTGDRTQITAALANFMGNGNGAPLDTSTLDILASQIYNEPLTAPLEQAGTVLSNTATAAGDAAKKVAVSAFGNFGTYIILGVVGLVLFFYFGGADVIRRKLSRA